MIGIVGGIGPLAGIDLYKKILEYTHGPTDQDHLPVLLASLPGEIMDRNAFLLEGIGENPAIGLAKIIRMLENAGANHIAIACNTVHAPAIFKPLLQLLKDQGSKVDIINLIDITIKAIKAHPNDYQRIGVLATSGAYKTGLFQNALHNAGLTPMFLPFERHNSLIHKAIYQIKISGEAVDKSVVSQLDTAIQELKNMGAQAILLGCTEIGMIENILDFNGLPVFNPNTILAQTLILKHSPQKLRR